MNGIGLPVKQGMYDPQFEKDACGIGFVANIKGNKSHQILRDALQVLINIDHRGGQGEENTGDGAGVLLQIPHAFFEKESKTLGLNLPQAGEYGVGMLFLPTDAAQRAEIETILNNIVAEEGQTLIGWRTVPTSDHGLGLSAKAAQPFVRQIFIGKSADVADQMAFERKLYIIRKRAEKAIRFSGQVAGGNVFYVTSLSSSTIVYKGMLTPEQVSTFYVELQNEELVTALALVHSRFSTNTFPTWERAHPYRFVIHNGEINTLRGNVNWMHARQNSCESELFGNDIKKAIPVIDNDGSDTAMFDNTMEFLYLGGRSLAHAAMMMIPEPWSNHESMSEEKKAFYEFHSCLMEPWDGPAAVSFTDGKQIGAILDRNGLRPARYYVTKDDRIILASEAGVLPVPAEDILIKERLRPGRMLLVDTVQGRIIPDEEVKAEIANENPYAAWLKDQLVTLEQLPEAYQVPAEDHETVVQRQQAFGYKFEELRKLLEPMAKSGVEAIGSMGYDAPLAVLSSKSQRLYNYFKQLFAQVTNPPIDALREEIITSATTTIGGERNLLDPQPESARQISLKSPILSNEDFAKLRHITRPGFKSATLPIFFNPTTGGAGLENALEEICAAADRQIEHGTTLLILSDRGMDADNCPIPALLAVSAVHHHLIRKGTRTKISLLLESGEPREVHHMALLIGFGASVVNPYLAFETFDDMIKQGLLKDVTHEKAIYNYIKSCTKGVVKILSKMGISTIQSYRGAQIFEAVGIAKSVVDKYFTWTPTRIEGIDIHQIAEEAIRDHQRAYSKQDGVDPTLDVGGDYQWRKDGEQHLYNPLTIHTLQQACRTNDFTSFKKYTGLVNDQSEKHMTLRGLLKFKASTGSVPIEEVETVEAIMKRFKTGAMSYGSISKEAHESMAIAMNRIGGKSNTGEGGEDPARFTRDANGDLRRSAIKQVASGRFGVTSNYLVNADEIQIKMAQGAKPGEGGQLPGRKVYPWIAEVRGSTTGVGLISPPPHHDIYSIEDLAELIHDLKNANPRARINVKLVSEVGVGTIAAGVAKGRADVVLVSGYEGGTGASPQTSIRHAGLPWELGLAETHQTLVLNNLRDRIVVETDGKLMTGRDVVIATMLGAEEYGFSTAPLVVLGCVMMRVCHLDTCPVGVATQNPDLRKKFGGDPAHVVNFMRFIATEMREIMAELGFRTINEMVGRTDALETNQAVSHWKAKGVDLSPLLYQPEVRADSTRFCCFSQDHRLDKSLDMRELLPLAQPAIESGTKVEADVIVTNVDRVVGTITGSEVTRKYGAAGLPEDTITFNFKGSAGQSFGGFVPKGMTLKLEGDSNDYFGKGLSGGKLVVRPSEKAGFKAEDNVIIGNVAFYGATKGEAYINGIAGERFAVRNSGVTTVVEGVGDHGCEYMTGGRVVILGTTGRNFAAGMSGGIAYVYDATGDFVKRCNIEMVGLENLAEQSVEEIQELKTLIENHVHYTGSNLGKTFLNEWNDRAKKFVKVIPKDYKRMMDAIERVKKAGLSGEDAVMAAFEANMKDISRVSGN